MSNATVLLSCQCQCFFVIWTFLYFTFLYLSFSTSLSSFVFQIIMYDIQSNFHLVCFPSLSGSWYNFNDSTVSITNEDSITHCRGYILFYTRQYPNVAVIENIKDKSRLAWLYFVSRYLPVLQKNRYIHFTGRAVNNFVVEVVLTNAVSLKFIVPLGDRNQIISDELLMTHWMWWFYGSQWW